MILKPGEFDLIKAITRTQAKAVHKELPPGGEWKTVKGHHIYIKDGKVLAGAIPGASGAKKATKAQLKEHQENHDKTSKPKKGEKKNAGKSKGKAEPKKASGASKGKEPKKTSKQASEVKEPKTTKAPKKTTSKPTKTEGAGKRATKTTKPKSTSKGATTETKSSGAGKPVSGKPKATSEGGATKPKTAGKKNAKDTRHEAQKNRELAYDVGDKVGGARKDEFIAGFKAKPTATSLDELEKMSGAIAEKMVTKANLLPGFSFEDEHANGTELPTAIMKKLLFDRMAPKPDPSTPETRKAYLVAMTKFHRQIAGIKTWENMRNAIRELSEYGRNTSTKNLSSWARTIEYQTKRANGISQYERFPLKPEEIEQAKKLKKEYEDRFIQGMKDKQAFNFEALGEKFNNFFTDWDSRDRTIQTVNKNTKEGWDKYLTPQAKKAPKKKGEENKVWERKAEAEHLRTGGKPTKVMKPEDLMKDFGVRGVEFGNWVNDSSGKYHLQRCAEAFNDLSDVLGIDPKDISLNGRLAIAFGARGKGGSLAHYEPDRKVINMTKYGGAGSLAHEWGHALDNIMYQYSNGGQESLGHASEGSMGNHDPKLKELFNNVMEAIEKPTPGEPGGTVQLLLDSEAKSIGRYYPEMRRQVGSGMKPEEVYQHWSSKINNQYDTAISRVKTSSYYSNDTAREKEIKKYEQKRKRELNELPHYLAKELQLKQNGGKYSGEPYRGHIEIQTGKSEYMSRMEMTQPGKQQNGAHYWSQPAEVFARVFESYVQDKLKKDKRYNNYLVHGTEEGAVKALGAPFPLGKERAHMHKHMEALVSYISKNKALKKALEMELLKSFDVPGNMRRVSLEELLGSIHSTNLNAQFRGSRSAYNVPNPSEVIYIPLNRLKTVYQTEKATNWDKVQENVERMVAGENLEPIVIGFNYDIHDGQHRYEASHLCDFTHVPCVVMNTPNEIERQRAIEAYQEVWKGFHYPAHTHHHQHHEKKHGRLLSEDELRRIGREALGKEVFADDENYIYRGIGQKELDFIRKNGFVESKGKGNDADKNNSYTCFSTLYSQAQGYARSNYDLYNESQAYVIALPKPDHIRAVDGEIVVKGKTSSEGMLVIPIAK
jgi:hypothetical protein